MMEAAAHGEFHLVLFWSLDRFSREGLLETLQYRRTLTSYGVGWKSYTEQYLDSCSVFRDAVLPILATVAKQERVRAERAHGGRPGARPDAGPHRLAPAGGDTDRARVAELRGRQVAGRDRRRNGTGLNHLGPDRAGVRGVGSSRIGRTKTMGRKTRMEKGLTFEELKTDPIVLEWASCEYGTVSSLGSDYHFGVPALKPSVCEYRRMGS